MQPSSLLQKMQQIHITPLSVIWVSIRGHSPQIRPFTFFTAQLLKPKTVARCKEEGGEYKKADEEYAFLF